jgi:hypothetical protein
MAAYIALRRHLPTRANRSVKFEPIDRDAEFLGVINGKEAEEPESTRLSDCPISVSSGVLMGKMPTHDKIIKNGLLCKLTSAYEWKPMTIALTSAGLFFSRPGEEVLRDLIPLYEIVDTKKRTNLPGDNAANKIKAESITTKSSRNLTQQEQGPIGKVRMSEEGQDSSMHIMVVRTAEGGCNSGRTYYLKVESEDECNDWLKLLRANTQHAVMLKQAGPTLYHKLKYRVRRFYHSDPIQTGVAALIFASFLVNVAQKELADADDSPAFATLESFFTITFALELALNLFAHFFLPFFRVPPPAHSQESRADTPRPDSRYAGQGRRARGESEELPSGSRRGKG